MKTAGSKLGKVTEWNDDGGYGFLAPQNGAGRVFLHIKSLSARHRRPKVGEWIRYKEGRDERGRPRAETAVFLDSGKRKRTTNRSSKLPLVVCLAFLVGVCGMAFVGRLPDIVAMVMLGASALSFVLYAMDKSAAEKGQYRVPEANLHLVALVGGWPGALIAQQGFRHKTRKASFQRLFWGTVLINLAFLGFLAGGGDLQALVGVVLG